MSGTTDHLFEMTAGTEFGYNSFLTSRGERMELAWDDFKTRFEVIWLDILDADADLYEEAFPYLEQFRRMTTRDVSQTIPILRSLLSLLQKWVKKGEEEKGSLSVYLSRLESLLEEAQYYSAEFNPQIPPPPGVPFVPFQKAKRKNGKDTVVLRKRQLPKTESVSVGAVASQILSKKRGVRLFEVVSREGSEVTGRVLCSTVRNDVRGHTVVVPLSEVASLYHRCSSTPRSLVLPMLEHAANLSPLDEDYDDATLLALETFSETLKEHTDIAEVQVVPAEVVPGSFPRFEVFVEWVQGSRPTDVCGRALLEFKEGKLYSLKEGEWVSLGESDQEIAEGVYFSLETTVDLSPLRRWESNRVTGALSRLLESERNPSPYQVSSVLAGLRVALSFSENVLPSAVHISLEEESPRLQYFWWHQASGKASGRGDLNSGVFSPTPHVSQGDQLLPVPSPSGSLGNASLDADGVGDVPDPEADVAVLPTSPHEAPGDGDDPGLSSEPLQRLPDGTSFDATDYGDGPVNVAPEGSEGPSVEEAEGVYWEVVRTPPIRVEDGGAWLLGEDGVETPLSKFSSDKELVGVLSAASYPTGGVYERLSEFSTIPKNRRELVCLVPDRFGEVHEAHPKVTHGMMRSLGKLGDDQKFHTCCDCDMTIPRYPGAYPKTCPNCGCDLCAQPGYPSKTIPDTPVLSDDEPVVESLDRDLRALLELTEMVHARTGLGMVPWSPNHRVLALESIEESPGCGKNGLELTFGVYLPIEEARNSRVGVFSVSEADLTLSRLLSQVQEVRREVVQRESVTALPGRTLTELVEAEKGEALTPEQSRKRKSQGHLGYLRDPESRTTYEYYKQGSEVYRAPVDNPVMTDGFRSGRDVCPASQWEKYCEIYGLELSSSMTESADPDSEIVAARLGTYELYWDGKPMGLGTHKTLDSAIAQARRALSKDSRVTSIDLVDTGSGETVQTVTESAVLPEAHLVEATHDMAKVPVKKAEEYSREVLSKAGKDIEKELPDFEKNYKQVQGNIQRYAKNIPRNKMPVIEPVDMKDFESDIEAGDVDHKTPYAPEEELKKIKATLKAPLDYVGGKSDEWRKLGTKDGETSDDQVDATWKRVPAKKLRPLQGQIWLDKVVGNIAKFGVPKQGSPVTDSPLIASKEGYILDGHHRYAQAMMADPDLKLRVLSVELPIDHLLKLGRSYSYAIGRTPKESVEKDDLLVGEMQGDSSGVAFVSELPYEEEVVEATPPVVQAKPSPLKNSKPKDQNRSADVPKPTALSSLDSKTGEKTPGTMTPPESADDQQQGSNGNQSSSGDGQSDVRDQSDPVSQPQQSSGPKVAELRLPSDQTDNCYKFLRAMGMEAERRGGSLHVTLYSDSDLEVLNRVALAYGLTMATWGDQATSMAEVSESLVFCGE